MPTSVKEQVPLPPPSAPVIDLKTGLMNIEWFEYFRSLDKAFRLLLRELA